MARTIGKLSALGISRLPSGHHGDGGGLWLQVTEAGARSWVMRFTFQGKRREMGLGPIHTISLEQARESAKKARQMLLDGIDPINARKERRRLDEQTKANTLSFAPCCTESIDSQKTADDRSLSGMLRKGLPSLLNKDKRP